MLINCTNHPYEIWNEAQRKAAAAYGEVLDIPFPQIDPKWTTQDLRKLTEEYCEKIKSHGPECVMVAGEFTFAFMLVDKLLSDGIKVVCSCSRRMTVEVKKDDGTNEKQSVFLFEGFREYTRY